MLKICSVKSTPSLDYDKTKAFWEDRVSRIGITGDTYVANLADNIPLLAVYKDEIEKKIILDNVLLNPEMEVLDLGCGSGRMLLFFAKKCKSVVGVDFSLSLLKLAAKKIEDEGIKNVRLIQGFAADFSVGRQFDIIFLGGLSSYLNDKEFNCLLSNIRRMLKKNGKLIIRDSFTWRRRCTVDNKYTSNFHASYSVIYRNIKEYRQYFNENRFKIIFEKSLNIFPFVGLYHFIIRRIFRQNDVFRYLSLFYFRLVYSLRYIYRFYQNTFVYKIISYLFNRYDQRIFVYTL